MNLVLVGLSHRTAPVEVRERLVIAPSELVRKNAELRSQLRTERHAGGGSESALISTCNRTEVLSVAEHPDVAHLREFFEPEARDLLYEFHGPDAVRHVFRVAASLDSMVLGEAQILGQLKSAYRAAFDAGSCGPVLHQMFQRAFRTGKRVRSQTGLGAGQVSVASVGVQLAAEIFESLEQKRVVVVGAGEMAESALSGLRAAGARDVVILNRTREAAERLAGEVGATSGSLDALHTELAACDVVLTSLAVERPVLTLEALRGVTASRNGRALLMIDLGIPRNVEPAVNELDDVYVYDLDDLDAVAQRGQAQRLAATAPAEAIVARECDLFERWRAGLVAVPLIKALRERGEALVEQELRRALSGLDRADAEAHAEARRALERLAGSLLARLLHDPVTRLRAEAEDGNAPYYADAIAEIFGLAEDDE